ncbi:antitoxin [Alysiella filiformis]|uniref:Antitoxin VapB n=1 Tax=Alysiella filiformis DSM 16848 TaxID=1120981 RepID=A0A286E8X9_9NEIS|nr:hypothetical protein [Alysiella filiformis]QMT32120.1 hypothetical protein H3L97_04455 [Alysiella filiformis]UBQ56967.1 hypothetical protein JF568_04220 [Alysiella filiformis DSM 16848]SOD67314.1 antitoxin VapB [Alysiella filiformis DSM 16848]
MLTTMPLMAGNVQAIHLPKSLAFEPNVPVVIHKENDKLIIEPVQTLANVPELFAQLGNEQDIQRETLAENERTW